MYPFLSFSSATSSFSWDWFGGYCAFENKISTEFIKRQTRKTNSWKTETRALIEVFVDWGKDGEKLSWKALKEGGVSAVCWYHNSSPYVSFFISLLKTCESEGPIWRPFPLKKAFWKINNNNKSHIWSTYDARVTYLKFLFSRMYIYIHITVIIGKY